MHRDDGRIAPAAMNVVARHCGKRIGSDVPTRAQSRQAGIAIDKPGSGNSADAPRRTRAQLAQYTSRK